MMCAVGLGTASGSVLLYKLNTSCLYKDFCIHSHRVAGIEWLSLHVIITFVNSPPNQTSLCRSEAALTDIQTGSLCSFYGYFLTVMYIGQVTYFRKSKQEESAISFIRVSPQKLANLFNVPSCIVDHPCCGIVLKHLVGDWAQKYTLHE